MCFEGMSCRIILRCFAFQYQQDAQKVIYITESVTDPLIELDYQSLMRKILRVGWSRDSQRRSQDPEGSALRPSLPPRGVASRASHSRPSTVVHWMKS